jgi:4-hydroxy-2-oxoheptanedioate aldolase
LADPWPLNPKGEILLGLKIEDRYCVDNAEKIAAVPGIGFAEWGPGDMGMSYGDPDAHDPPYPEFMNEAREKVRAALDKSNVAFYSSWNDKKLTIKERVDHLIDNVGAKILAGLSKDYADYGRIKTGL